MKDLASLLLGKCHPVWPARHRAPFRAGPPVCTHCGEVKAADDFYPARRKKDGTYTRRTWCKACEKANVRARRHG